MKKISKILFFTVCLIVYLNIGHAYIKTMHEVAEKQQAVTFTENIVSGPKFFNIASTRSLFQSKGLSITIDTVLWPIFLLISLLGWTCYGFFQVMTLAWGGIQAVGRLLWWISLQGGMAEILHVNGMIAIVLLLALCYSLYKILPTLKK